MNKKRLMWLDCLKGMLILFVILGHILVGFTENNAFPAYNGGMEKLEKWIYIWHMPTFMLLSGFSVGIAYLNNNMLDKKRYIRQFCNIVLLYCFFQGILCILKTIFSKYVDNGLTIDKALINFIYPDTIMWYLWVLAAYYVMVYFLLEKNVFFTNRTKILFSIILAFVSIIGRYIGERYSLGLVAKWLPFCFYYFCNGIYRAHNGSKQVGRRNIIVLIIGLLVSLLLFTKIYAVNDCFLTIVYEFITANLIIEILLFVAQEGDWKNKWLVKLGRYSLVIFITHTYIISALKYVIIKSKYDNAVMAIIGTFLVTVVICTIFIKIIERCNPLRMLFSPILILDKKRYDRKSRTIFGKIK